MNERKSITPIISVVGKSNAGKTTLLEKLLPVLKDRGYRVGTIKHDAHQFEIDHPGKDTFRHFHAGAEQVLITSPAKLAVIKRQPGERTLDELLDLYCHDVDFVITEGFKRSDKPKIEVVRAARSPESICTREDNLIARVSDVNFTDDIPLFTLDDIGRLADFIIDHLFNAKNTPAS